MKTIHQIATQSECRTDKQDAHHSFRGKSYLHHYDQHFAPFRQRVVNLLEIGVAKGNSLRLWRDYFPHGNIYGLDIDPDAKTAEGDRICVFIGNQNDCEFLETVGNRFPNGLDIIIDDGSHLLPYLLTSFRCLWPRVAPGGYYVLEDMGLSYVATSSGWTGAHWNDRVGLEQNHRSDFDVVFHKLLRNMDAMLGDIQAIHLYPMLYFFRKVT